MFEICRSCGQPVARDAVECPHCGDDDPLAPMELGEDDGDEFAGDDSEQYDEFGQEVSRPAVARRSSGEVESWRDHYDRGLALIHSEQIDEALFELTQALVEAPDESLADCYAHRGYAYLTSDQFQRAIDDCQQAIAANPRMAEAYAWRGAAYAGLRRWREAILDYVEAIRRARDAARQEYEEIAKSYADQALTEYHRAIRTDPENSRLYQDRGLALAIKGDHRRAIKDFSDAIRLDPQDGFSLLHRAEMHAASGAVEKAVADYSAALRLGQRQATTFHQRGRLLLDLGHVDRAIADFTQAVTLDDACAAAFVDRARAYVRASRHREAAADFSQAIALDRMDGQTYFQRAEAHLVLGEAEAAVADLTEALALNPTDVSAYTRRGIARLRLQDYDEAILDFDEAIRLDAACAEAYRGRGVAYAAQENPERAIAELTKALRVDPRFVPAYDSRGDAYLALERYDEAIADYTRVLEFSDDLRRTAAAHYTRGVAYMEKRQYAKAVEDFSRAIDRRRTDDAAYAWRAAGHFGLAAWRNGIDDYLTAIRLAPARAQEYRDAAAEHVAKLLDDLESRLTKQPDDAEALADRALIRALAGSYRDAYRDLSAALKLRPDASRWLFDRGMVLAELGKIEHALIDFDRAIKLGETGAAAYYQRGLAHRRAGHLNRAAADLTEAITRDPVDPLAAIERGRVHVSAGRFDKAYEDFTTAVGLNPADPQPLVERAAVLSQQNRLDAALADLSRAIEIDSSRAEPYKRRGDVYVRARQVDAAIADYDAAIRRDPLLASAYAERGLALARQGKLHTALIELTKAIGRVGADRSFAAAYDARARIYFNVGDYTRAILDHNMAYRLAAAGHDSAATLVGRGLACLKKGDNEEAIRSLTKALELNPASTMAATALRRAQGDQSVDLPALRTPALKFAPKAPRVRGKAITLQAESLGEYEFHVDRSLLPKALWIVRDGQGQEFGPVTKEELNTWASQGRLDTHCQLLRVDWEDYLAAGDVYPELPLATHQRSSRPILVSAAPEEALVDELPAEVEQTAAPSLADMDVEAPSDDPVFEFEVEDASGAADEFDFPASDDAPHAADEP